MAPELFESDQVHSYQSDFWSLGCTLYELRRGYPPFGSADSVDMEKLIGRIASLDPIRNPLPYTIKISGGGENQPSHSNKKDVNRNRNENVRENREETADVTLTADLADLILWCLEKSPLSRACWNTNVCEHTFWKPNCIPTPRSLPPQPMFDAIIQ